MKKIFTLLFSTLFYVSIQAQCLTGALTVANGNSGLGRAPSGSFMSIRTVYLVTAAEMAAAGFTTGQNFSEIGWTYNTVPAAAVTGNLSVYLENTSDATYSKGTDWPTAISSMSQHRNASTTLPAASGQFSVPLTSNFTYNGGGVYVAFEWLNCGSVIAGVTAGCNTSLVGGLRNITSAASCVPAATMTSTSSFRPLTAFGSAVPNDAKLTYIYNQGQMIVGKSTNIPFSANVTNNSGTAMTNVPVTLQISGANTFTATATIASLPACSTQTVAFTTPYTPANEGIDSVMVYIPADANPLNDTIRVQATVNKDVMSYRNLGQNPVGGVGVNAGTGTLAIKFNTATAGYITHAELNFNTVTIPSQYRIAIYGDNGGIPSTTALYSDVANRTNATGNFSIPLDNPLSVTPGTYYLAIQQMSTDNMSLGYASEVPLRTGTFFFSSNPPATWTDLGGGANPFKVLSGIRFCSPLAVNAILGSATGCEGSSVLLRADTVGRPGITYITWVLPPGYIGTSTTDSIYVRPYSTPGDIKCVANYVCGPSDTTYFTFNPTPLSNTLSLSNVGNSASSTGVQTTNNVIADGGIVTYSDPSCQPIALVADFPGGNVLGATAGTVNVDASVSSYNGQPYARRWFTVTPTTNGPATVVLYVSQADFTDYNTAAVGWPPLPTSGNNSDPNIGNIRVTKVDGVLGTGPATVITPSVFWNATTSYWELTFSVPNFSSMYIHSVNPSNVALPIEWLSFTANKEKTYNQLEWKTSSELNNKHFNIQYSTDANRFTNIGQVASKSLNGFSNEILSYSFKHNEPQNGANYYRIEQVDQDNRSSYSELRQVIWGDNGNTYSIYPQPANEQLMIDASLQQTAHVQIEIIDLSGKVVYSQNEVGEVGLNHLTVHTSSISNGLYFIRLSENNKVTFTQKISVQH